VPRPPFSHRFRFPSGEKIRPRSENSQRDALVDGLAELIGGTQADALVFLDKYNGDYIEAKLAAEAMTAEADDEGAFSMPFFGRARAKNGSRASFCAAFAWPFPTEASRPRDDHVPCSSVQEWRGLTDCSWKGNVS
jgi:hypothetical protein